jgi:signal transduction histidine kinase
VDLNIELERVLSVMATNSLPGTVILRNMKPLPMFGCSPGLFSQAFLNIIQNAIQSRSEGAEIQVASTCTDKEIIIRIADNGCGIPAGNLSRVFEPFFTTREVGQGTGMGLTVAREIVTTAGGTIELESQEATGTTVVIRLPL